MRILLSMLILVLAVPASAGVITTVSVHLDPSCPQCFSEITDPDYRMVHAVDGSGLSGSPGGHAVAAPGNSWMGLIYAPYGDIAFMVDLGAEYTLSGVRVWNLNLGGSQNLLGADDVGVFGSHDGPSWTGVLSDGSPAYYNFPTASGLADDAGFPLDITGWQPFRYLFLLISSNHTGGQSDNVGLSEIRFYSDRFVDPPSGVPEPSMFALLGGGIVGLIAGSLLRRPRWSPQR